MLTEITRYLQALAVDAQTLATKRMQLLRPLAEHICGCQSRGEDIHLVFICTHNSRRSHFGQVWAAAAAAYLGIPGVITYSGGTEATACNERTVAALQRVGFQIANPGGHNPRYQVNMGEGPVLECWSKTFDDPANPAGNFAAVMTCTEADKNCPLISGATLRVPLPYEDPKVSDDTEEEVDIYDARCREIASEMLWLMEQVHNRPANQ